MSGQLGDKERTWGNKALYLRDGLFFYLRNTPAKQKEPLLMADTSAVSFRLPHKIKNIEHLCSWKTHPPEKYDVGLDIFRVAAKSVD